MILLDTSNKPAQEFLIYCKIQDGRQGLKVQNRPNLTPQNTLLTSLSKNLSVCSCQILSKSDERDQNAEPKCDLLGQFSRFLTFD